ncbi:PepSY domain-containing protein [Ensifer sp. HO-A22]|jgi:uncharacterized membrane protein YkoI|uniref:PepSY domain-containing protein n=1 Tax=Ensifer oleiphilus TaxID=2742698 RepID=A0A7Y6UND8_9HYPH|nr:PepSY domain-containing protein [Ensifer oleiphilus]NVD39929.1 PepSY domain-containing protein [Ensifer oleiphilus]
MGFDRLRWLLNTFEIAVVASVILGVAFGGTVDAHADDDNRKMQQGDDAREGIRRGVGSGSIKSLAALRRIVQARFDGQIVSTKFDREHGRPVYEFRILAANDRLIEVEVDAATGDILEVENEE